MQDTGIDMLAMTLAELEAQIAEFETQAELLRSQRVEAKQKTISALAEGLTEYVATYGVELDEVIHHLRPELFDKPKRERKQKSDGAQKRVQRAPRAVYRDEAGREYKGGKWPQAIVDVAASLGITPAEYRDAWMKKVA